MGEITGFERPRFLFFSVYFSKFLKLKAYLPWRCVSPALDLLWEVCDGLINPSTRSCLKTKIIKYVIKSTGWSLNQEIGKSTHTKPGTPLEIIIAPILLYRHYIIIVLRSNNPQFLTKKRVFFLYLFRKSHFHIYIQTTQKEEKKTRKRLPTFQGFSVLLCRLRVFLLFVVFFFFSIIDSKLL